MFKSIYVENEQPNFDINELADKWLKGTITPEEKTWYEQWYGSFDDSHTQVSKSTSSVEIGERIYNKLDWRIHRPEGKPIRKIVVYLRLAAAASIILSLSVGGYFIRHKHFAQQTVQNQHDIAPGHMQATLTLANGEKIILKKELKGKLAQQGNVVIQNGSGNAITYTSINTAETKVEYNTMSTSKGEMSPYPLILADGTKVWLNAASSITFPIAFTGKDRSVKITGEVYFEVAHNAATPFTVTVKGQTIEDIGTHFNINAYDDESVIKTTLLEGSISVTEGKEKVILKPGQESLIRPASNSIIVKDANLDQAIAWKNGLFDFDHTNIKTVMRQVARWYNVDIEYEGNVSSKKLTGEMYQSVNASQALQILKYANINFRIENKKIIITP